MQVIFAAACGSTVAAAVVRSASAAAGKAFSESLCRYEVTSRHSLTVVIFVIFLPFFHPP